MIRNNLLRFLLVVPLFVAFALLLSVRAQQRGLKVGQSSPQGGAGRYYALVIGNQAYAGLPRLKTAAADARAVNALLREHYGFETKLLLDATRQQIIWAIYSYRQTLKPDDNLLIYYAGHGIKDSEEEKAYWLPIDATREDPSNWIIADEITARIKVIPALHVLIVSDSCYSGMLMRGIAKDLPRPAERERYLQRMMAGRSRTLMASGGDEPVADGGGGGQHSVFANALLRGLREMDRDGFTAAELFRYHVEESVAGRAQQMPEYHALRSSGHEGGDFVFVRVKAQTKREAATRNAPPLQASDLELDYWNAIKDSLDPEDYQRYLEKYPGGQFAATAQQRAATAAERDGSNMGGVDKTSGAATDKSSPGAANKAQQSSLAGKTTTRRQVSHTDGGQGERQSQDTRDAEPQTQRGKSGRGRRP